VECIQPEGQSDSRRWFFSVYTIVRMDRHSADFLNGNATALTVRGTYPVAMLQRYYEAKNPNLAFAYPRGPDGG
jgi:hypothetical protein